MQQHTHTHYLTSIQNTGAATHLPPLLRHSFSYIPEPETDTEQQQQQQQYIQHTRQHCCCCCCCQLQIADPTSKRKEFQRSSSSSNGNSGSNSSSSVWAPQSSPNVSSLLCICFCPPLSVLSFSTTEKLTDRRMR